MSKFLGIVRDNKFQPLEASSSLNSSVRLTRINMAAGGSPENREIDLTEYEGNAIMVEGTPSGKWIYQAEIVDRLDQFLLR